MALLREMELFLMAGLCFGAFTTSLAVDEVIVLHVPDSVKLLSDESIHSSYLGDIFCAMLAYTVRSSIDWNGLAVVSPWKAPKAIAVVEVAGFDGKATLPLKGNHFLLENAGDIPVQFDLLSYRTEERFLGKRPVLLHMDLGSELHDAKIVQPMLLKSIPADPRKRLHMAVDDPELNDLIQKSVFNTSVPSDVQFLTELASTKEFLKLLRAHKSDVHDNVPDVYWLVLGGLAPITNIYGIDSVQYREAMRLLKQILSEVERVMRDVYDDNVVVAVMTVENSLPPLGYKNRKLLAETETSTKAPAPSADYNLAIMWDRSFPVTFTIISFVTIIIFLAILGISVAMWNMDPGKDSIIYRATQRMKRD